MRPIDADALEVFVKTVRQGLYLDKTLAPVVRCKDCKFSKPHEQFEKLIKCMRPYNCKHGLNFPKEGFCSYGEKMEGKPCG